MSSGEPAGGGSRPARARATPRAGGADSERRILEALDALLREGESFTSLDVRRITERAAVGRTSFYNHFPDKTAVLLELLRPATRAIFEAATGWVIDPRHDAESLRVTTLRVLAEYRAHAHLLRALSEANTYDPRAADYWRAEMERVSELFRRRIEETRRRRGVVGGTDARTAAMWLTWGTERAIFQHVTVGSGGVADEDFAEVVSRNVWATMTERPAD